MHLFPVAGFPPWRIYVPWSGSPPDRQICFCDIINFIINFLWLLGFPDEEMRNGWRPRNQTTGGRVWEYSRKCPTQTSRVLQINISPTSDVLENHRVGVYQVLNIGTGRRSRKNVWNFLWRSTTRSQIHRVKVKMWGRKWPYRWNSGGILASDVESENPGIIVSLSHVKCPHRHVLSSVWDHLFPLTDLLSLN